jgi:hypothetical protein
MLVYKRVQLQMKFCFPDFFNFEILRVKEMKLIQNGGRVHVCALTLVGSLAAQQNKIIYVI